MGEVYRTRGQTAGGRFRPLAADTYYVSTWFIGPRSVVGSNLPLVNYTRRWARHQFDKHFLELGKIQIELRVHQSHCGLRFQLFDPSERISVADSMIEIDVHVDKTLLCL